MFNQHDLLRLQKTFSNFSLDQVCRTTNTDLPALFHYLEFYGFLYTLKGMPVEYYSGYRVPAGRAKRWGRIATHYWRLHDAKATVFLVHGLFDHVGLYQPLVRHLLSQGFSVAAVDLPGHGLSDGEPTVISSFYDYAEVVDEALAFFRPKIQGDFYGLGQSTGAAVIMAQSFKAADRGVDMPYQGLILLSPLVRCARWSWVKLVFRVASPFLSFVRRSFSESSNDSSFNQFLQDEDILQSKQLSVAWVRAMLGWGSKFEERDALSVPALLVQGNDDKVVDHKYNLPAIKAKIPDVEIVKVPNAMHHLVNEAELQRGEVFGAISNFLSRQ